MNYYYCVFKKKCASSLAVLNLYSGQMHEQEQKVMEFLKWLPFFWFSAALNVYFLFLFFANANTVAGEYSGHIEQYKPSQ